jgi:hypothetical protein
VLVFVNIVPVVVGTVNVMLLAVFSGVRVMLPPRVVLSFRFPDMIILYTTVQTDPADTVTVIPVATEIVPADIAFDPTGIV